MALQDKAEREERDRVRRRDRTEHGVRNNVGLGD